MASLQQSHVQSVLQRKIFVQQEPGFLMVAPDWLFKPSTHPPNPKEVLGEFRGAEGAAQDMEGAPGGGLGGWGGRREVRVRMCGSPQWEEQD